MASDGRGLGKIARNRAAKLTMTPRFAALLLLGVAAALRLPQQQTFMLRRAALQQSAAAAAAAALLAAPAQALDKAEFAKAVADKREAERVAALPASRLKTLRDSLANDAPALLEAGDWGKLRNAIVAARKSTGALVAETKRDLRPLTKALDAQLYSLDEFAYSQEAVMPGMFSGYCAQGVVPRDEPGACKVRPTADLKVRRRETASPRRGRPALPAPPDGYSRSPLAHRAPPGAVRQAEGGGGNLR